MLIEKAFTKLHGNYKSIAWGSMFESGNIFLGTGGKRIYTSTMTAGQIYSTVADWNSKSYIIGAKGYTSSDGIWHNHFYTLISEHTLSNGVQIFKLRNPNGANAWGGPYKDSDPFWTDNPTDAQAVGFTNKHPSIFFMSVVAFKGRFTDMDFNYDPTNWKHSYWMARGNGHWVGVPGITNECGSTCKRTKFLVTSPIAQTIYISTYVQKHRQYI